MRNEYSHTIAVINPNKEILEVLIEAWKAEYMVIGMLRLSHHDVVAHPGCFPGVFQPS